MAINGQAIKQDFVILAKPTATEITLVERPQIGCCFELTALAEITETSDYSLN